MTNENTQTTRKERINNYKQLVQEAINKCEDCIQNINEKFISLSNDLNSEVKNQLNEQKETFESIETEFNSLTQNLNSTIKKINDNNELIETIKNDIEAYETELLKGDDDTTSIKDKIKDCFEIINQINDEAIQLNEKLFGVQQKTIQITKVQADQLDKSKYLIRDGKYFKIEREASEGISQRIDNLEKRLLEKEKNIDEIFNKNFSKYDKEFLSIKTKIEELLPGATSAGLASAYETTRKYHTTTEKRWGWHFFCAMVGITVLGGASIYFNYGISDPYDIFKNVLKLFPFELPLIWYAWLASKRIREEARLHEEHLHKWSVARSFEGLSQQARALDSENDRKNESHLFGEVISSYSSNPSHVIDVKGANTPVEKIVEGVINGINKIQK